MNSKQYLAMGLLLAGSVASAEGVKVGGFVAPAFMWTKDATNTFAIPDGALYLSHSMDMAEVMVDIPFMMDNSGTTNTMSLGSTKAQAYVHHKMENGVFWKLGQFDGLYGYARNDMANWPFTTQSQLWGTFVPLTHTGLNVGYSFSDMMSVSLLFADPANKSYHLWAKGSAYDSMPRYDMGLQLKAAMDSMNFAVGWLMNKSTKSVSTNLFDVVAGMDMDQMHLGLNFVMNKTTKLDAAMGFGVLAKMSMTDMIAAGARVEWSRDSAKTKMLGLTVGPQFKMTDALETRVDYTLHNSKANGASKATNSHTVNVAAVYSF